MRKIIAITQVTLDGVMQAPGEPAEDLSNGFTQGGWFMRFVDQNVMQAVDEIISSKFDLLLGRLTYDIWVNYWPHHGDNPIGKALNQATKYVVTRRRDSLAWEKSIRIGGDVVEELRRLKTSNGPTFHVWGSGNLLQTLIAADLVDEHRIWVVPIVLGQGKRLFENGLPPSRLELVDTRPTPNGVLINTYRSRRQKSGPAQSDLIDR